MNIDQPQGMTRQQFLSTFPVMADWVEDMEKMYGPFLRCGSLILSNQRVVLVVRFEQIWHINFDNPANKKAERERTINLSTEALFAVIGLAMTFMGQAEYQQYWEQMIEMVKVNNPIKDETANDGTGKT